MIDWFYIPHGATGGADRSLHQLLNHSLLNVAIVITHIIIGRLSHSAEALDLFCLGRQLQMPMTSTCVEQCDNGKQLALGENTNGREGQL